MHTNGRGPLDARDAKSYGKKKLTALERNGTSMHDCETY